MKRILLICLLFTATVTLLSVQRTVAQTVTQASFMAKVSAMDTYIGAGNTTAAQTTWNSIHVDMLNVISVTQNNIRKASNPTDVANYTNSMANQRAIYRQILALHNDLTTNRSAIYTALSSFEATIY